MPFGVDMSSFRMPLVRTTPTEEDRAAKKQLQIIGAGLPRTGTASMHTALVQLGFAPCHHMASCFADLPLCGEWIRAFKGEQMDYRKMLNGYAATVDAPGCMVVPELMEQFPDAKVILTVRDPQRWADSVNNTIRTGSTPFYRWLTIWFKTLRVQGGLSDLIWESWGKQGGERVTPDFYEKHNAYIRSIVPKERLLEFNAKEGWEPLCKFLDVPIPEGPYPRTNDTKSLTNTIRLVTCMGIAVWTFVLGTTATAVYFGWPHIGRVVGEL